MRFEKLGISDLMGDNLDQTVHDSLFQPETFGLHYVGNRDATEGF